MGRLSVRCDILMFSGPTAWVRQSVAALFLTPGPAVTTILRTLLRFKCVSSLWTRNRLGLTPLTGSTMLFSIRHRLRQSFACLTVRILCGLFIM